MNASLGRVLTLLARSSRTAPDTLDGFVDSLLQSFENCRPGLTDEVLSAGDDTVAGFFVELYQKEIPRLVDSIRLQESTLSAEARQEFFSAVDRLIRKVVIPAYVRSARRFTPRERNGFYVTPEPLHGLERAAWCVVGMAVGGFVVWAPFIPLWEKYWVLPFAIGGLFVPNFRRILSLRAYESELNRLVDQANREILRIDTAYLTSGEALEVRGRLEAGSESARAARPLPVEQKH